VPVKVEKSRTRLVVQKDCCGWRIGVAVVVVDCQRVVRPKDLEAFCLIGASPWAAWNIRSRPAISETVLLSNR
jgi:hypothetical protein